MKKLFIALFVLGLTAAIFISPLQQAEGRITLPVNPLEEPELTVLMTFVNITKHEIIFSVDGKIACTAQPENECSIRVTPGWHNFRADIEGYPEKDIENGVVVPAKDITWVISAKLPINKK